MSTTTIPSTTKPPSQGIAPTQAPALTQNVTASTTRQPAKASSSRNSASFNANSALALPRPAVQNAPQPPQSTQLKTSNPNGNIQTTVTPATVPTVPNTVQNVNAAAHLADGQVYGKAIQEHFSNNPNLEHKDWKVPGSHRSYVPKSRVKVLSFDKSSCNDTGTVIIETATALLHHFQQASQPARRLYILEGTNPAFVEILGSQFGIDPTFFSRHKRTALWEQVHKGGNTAKLASTYNHQREFFLEYAELLYFAEDPKFSSFRNPADMRHINTSQKPSISSDLNQVGILHRKASFWSSVSSQVSPQGANQQSQPQQNTIHSWNALIVVDPSIPAPRNGGSAAKELLVGSSKAATPHTYNITLYQGGYLDFMPFNMNSTTSHAPKRESMFEDLSSYWSYYKTHLDVGNDGFETSALLSTFFLQKIIASNYMLLVGFLESNVNELETAILRMEIKEHKKNMTTEVEAQFRILQSWAHRLPEYGGMVDDIMTWHADAGKQLPQAARDKWNGCTKDFTEIQRRLRAVRDRAQILNESFVGLASMAGMQESLDETKAVKLLTVLGFIFVPASTIATIFSMPEHAPTKIGGFVLYSKIAFSMSGVLTFFIVCYLWWFSLPTMWINTLFKRIIH